MGAPILKLENVYKQYGQNLVLNGIDLALESAKLYALLGRNGSGKSTLMRLLTRHEPIDYGLGVFLGQDMNIDDEEINNKIGFASELISYALIGTNLQDILNFHKSMRPSWDEAFVKEAASIMNLPLNSSFDQLSRGQKMQLCYIVARAFSPKILLLDEITSVLDPVARKFLIQDLEKFVAAGGTAVLATNIVHEIQDSADNIILIAQGRISFNSPKQALTDNFQRVVRNRGDQHEIFGDHHLIEVGVDSNGATHFLVEKALAPYVPVKFLSHSPVTASEAFIYLTRVK